MRTLVAPLVASVLLVGAAGLIIWNIELMTAAGPVINAVIVASVPVVFLAGTLYAVWLRRNRPADYARIATTNVDAEVLEDPSRT